MDYSKDVTLIHILESNDKILVELRILNKLLESVVFRNSYSNSIKVTGI